VLFTSAWTAIVNPDEKTLAYVSARTSDPFQPLVSDPDAKYAKEFSFNLSDVVPQVVPPPKRHTGRPVSDFAATPDNRGFVGSCANGWIEDMRAAAQILRGKKICPGVILNITPATPSVYKQCIKEGLLDIFIDAGVVVPSPGCSMCDSRNTPLARGDVCVSTATCNYPGRMGSIESEIYVASPMTVAASCLEGRIVDPRKYL
jgi:3-isopropylmalate/(R)-2-methylmalate dehydratase large subunit